MPERDLQGFEDQSEEAFEEGEREPGEIGSDGHEEEVGRAREPSTSSQRASTGACPGR